MPPTTPIDFQTLKRGELFPGSADTIEAIVFCDSHFCVYLNQDLSVCFQTDDDYHPYAPDFGRIWGDVVNLEATSKYFLARPQRQALQLLLGEAVARLLDDHDSTNAKRMLARAKKFLDARMAEDARTTYLITTFSCTAIALLFGCGLWIWRASVRGAIGTQAFETFFGGSLGALGAQLSVLTRVGSSNLTTASALPARVLDGASRIFLGVLCASILVLAVKGNVVLGVLGRDGNQLAVLLVLCVVAGVSEKLVPRLVTEIEGNLSHSSQDAPQTPQPVSPQPAQGVVQPAVVSTINRVTHENVEHVAVPVKPN